VHVASPEDSSRNTAVSEQRPASRYPVQPRGSESCDTLRPPPIPARKRGKRMSRRKGQNPVRVGKRADGEEYYFFQYWMDVAGEEERRRQTEVIGLVKHITKSEAERKKLMFISNLSLNSNDQRCSANHAENLVGLLEGQETSLLPSRTRNSRT
jgi:hypothetical protein